ncbi:MAG TPA: AraC family transcriptional regulator [Bacteroidia bacterium]|nr:AraC family transcriptional regulator [Bacteroidia bacterium]HNP98754.1 AraC family transcriptional regulator [Bacteroidia bacterium]
MENVFTVNSSSDWALPRMSCLINFSTLSELYCVAPFRSFSVKYVCRGTEKYHVNGNKYTVEDGQYLLANHFSEGFVEIDNTVRGICIDVAPDVLSEVVASYRRPDTFIADPGLDTFFNSPDFLENKFRGSDTHTGRWLHSLDLRMLREDSLAIRFSREFYFTLAEHLLADHIPVYKELQSIKGVKRTTRKELYRKVSMGKEYIDSAYLQNIHVADIASKCNLSEYHFYRTFKSAFGISPHQYIIQKRLAFGSTLLTEEKMSVSEAAYASGYADAFAFSKSFKKQYGHSPVVLTQRKNATEN